MKRVNFIGAPNFFNLNHACQALTEAFGYHVYLVGSSLKQKDYRDVDVRCILCDDEYDRLFPKATKRPDLHPLWSLMCTAISEWLSSRTGLPIDFQIQKQSDATVEYDGERHALGIFLYTGD